MSREPPSLEVLFAAETDDLVPPEHLAAIRHGLATALEASVSREAPASPEAPKTLTAVARAATWKVAALGIALVGASGVGFALGRASRAPREVGANAVVARPASSPGEEARPPALTIDIAASPGARDEDGDARAGEQSHRRTAAPPSRGPDARGSVTGTSSRARSVDEAGAKGAAAESSSFDREESLLERARSALLHHDLSAAKEALDVASREFSGGRHAEEREYLRVLVLRERGDRAAAEAAAKRFLELYPDGLFAPRVRALR